MNIKGAIYIEKFNNEVRAFLTGLLVGAGIQECTAKDRALEGQRGIDRIRDDNTEEIEEE